MWPEYFQCGLGISCDVDVAMGKKLYESYENTAMQIKLFLDIQFRT